MLKVIFGKFAFMLLPVKVAGAGRLKRSAVILSKTIPTVEVLLLLAMPTVLEPAIEKGIRKKM